MCRNRKRENNGVCSECFGGGCGKVDGCNNNNHRATRQVNRVLRETMMSRKRRV